MVFLQSLCMCINSVLLKLFSNVMWIWYISLFWPWPSYWSQQNFHQGLHMSLGSSRKRGSLFEVPDIAMTSAISPLGSLVIPCTLTFCSTPFSDISSPEVGCSVSLWFSFCWQTLYLLCRYWTCFTVISKMSAFSNLAVFDLSLPYIKQKWVLK